jgi:DegV family protein with EDD domain
MKLDAANTAIVLDSTADVADVAGRFPSWRVVPLYVRFGDESLRDYVDIGPAEFYERLRASTVTPTTSQPTPGDFLAAYEGLAGYERILSLHIGAKLSGTYASACTAAEQLGDGRVRTIDTGTASAAITMLALGIQRRLERGTSDEEVDRFVARYREGHGLLFTLETLEYLARGGRIGRARAWAGQLLNVKPVLELRDGEVVPLTRVRGNRRALTELVDRLAAGSADTPTLRLGIADADARERARQLEGLVRERRQAAEIEIVTALGAVIGTHAGPGTVGLFWYEDDEESVRTGA